MVHTPEQSRLVPNVEHSWQTKISSLGLVITYDIFRRIFKLRGWWYIVLFFSNLQLRSKEEVEINCETFRLVVPYGDPYWLRLIPRQFQYESEISNFLNVVKDGSCIFIDVGSNLGYWSLYACKNKQFNIIAIEPNPQYFAYLQRNLKQNGCSAFTINAAVSDTSEPFTKLYLGSSPGDHAGASLKRDPNSTSNPREVSVKAIKLQDVIVNALESEDRCLVKLDVEGMEKELFQTLQLLGDPRVAFIYEDHGKDNESRPSRFLLETHLYDVWFLDVFAGFVKCETLNDIFEMKRRKSVGYNLLAIPKEGKLWEDVVQST